MSIWWWALIFLAIYLAVSATIYIADGYFDFSYNSKDSPSQNHDSLMSYTFLWPIWLLFIPVVIPMGLRDLMVNLKKKKLAKEVEIKKLRIAKERELETYKVEVDDYLRESIRKRNSY